MPGVASTTTERHVEHRIESRIENPNATLAALVVRAAARADTSPRARIAQPSAPAPRSAEPRESAAHDAPPPVSVTIGRIDVHAPPAPSAAAPAPARRPAFRPSVTLDAFLRGGGGGR